MSKTRNLSDLLDANGDVKSTALDNVPASNDASALTTGTLDSARLGTVTNFTSTGIDDNATSTAVTIDSSQNVLVGTTDNSLYNNSGAGNGGVMLANTTDGGRVDIAREGVNLIHNRLASDGIIEEFKRDGTTVGKIDANSSGISIYLGGTGSANALDDYEEGTFTPSFSNFTGTVSNADYTKIGNIVHVQMYISSISGGSGADAEITNLPFTCDTNGWSPFIVNGQFSGVGFTYQVLGRVEGGTSKLSFKNNNDNNIHGSDIDASSFMTMQFTYKTS